MVKFNAICIASWTKPSVSLSFFSRDCDVNLSVAVKMRLKMLTWYQYWNAPK